jgi:hypothetical protein
MLGHGDSSVPINPPKEEFAPHDGGVTTPLNPCRRSQEVSPYVFHTEDDCLHDKKGISTK